MNQDQKVETFNSLWDFLLSNSPDISLVNKFLFAKMDCGLEIDPTEVLRCLGEKGLSPDSRTFGAFIHQSCSAGNMEMTSAHLQSLKLANLKPDPFIFSRILYGYLKAGCPEEVASTQEIMVRMGLWPSRIGYEGLLSAYAELGDRIGLLNVLNEAWEILPIQSRSIDLNRSNAAPFSPLFLISLYVKLLCAESQFDGTCVEDPQSISLFWELSDVSGARLNMLRRQTVIGKGAPQARRPPSRTSELYDTLKNAFARNDVDAVFNTLRDKLSGGSSIIYNYAVPQLLNHGLTAKQVIERIELRNVTTVPENSGELPSNQLSGVFDLLALALNMPQLKAVVNQMFEQCLHSFRSGFAMNASGNRRADDAKAVETLVDVCIMKVIYMPIHSCLRLLE
ncbi:uncharacterized protein DEA37_0002390 [Paragonimus westermani]|uniref:Pentatricopeptide repeat-containing protein n=1 Tax=Paragonimus westermani TaxID=34504 RepID=A0A5J4NE03_9TREM|nr:uncharacterized protein DEA37_0002390 [Paragonimus westermani]